MATGKSSLGVVKQVVLGQTMLEGAGVRVCRTLGQSQTRVDPFLMLDELKLPVGQATKGFPDHPHRGIATLTIMLKGTMEHRDSLGNQGVISDGACQFMVAGRGVIHSERPIARDPSSELHGFQLWVNLPAANKMVKYVFQPVRHRRFVSWTHLRSPIFFYDRPSYQDIGPEEIPTVDWADMGSGSVRVLAGSWNGTNGPIQVHHSQNIVLLDLKLDKGRFSTALADGFNCFCYVYEVRLISLTSKRADGLTHWFLPLLYTGHGGSWRQESRATKCVYTRSVGWAD